MSKFKTLEESQIKMEAKIKASERYQMILLVIMMMIVIGSMLLFAHCEDVYNYL